jgi:BlaI family transcriptional regulator, penicillinase repressor
MAKAPKISDAEWDVMTVLWQRSPITAQQVIDALSSRREWNPRTVRTFLNRLVKKGALGFEIEGNRYLYRPNVTREQCVREESQSFVSRVFGGSAGAMLVQFVQQADLTPEEVAELKKVLKRKGG